MPLPTRDLVERLVNGLGSFRHTMGPLAPNRAGPGADIVRAARQRDGRAATHPDGGDSVHG